jgi:aminotransferase in exopolysaccharide biosynthesis
MYKAIVDHIREIYGRNDFIPLHEPIFTGNEKKYVLNAIDTTFVSSVGEYVGKFEEMVRDFTGADYAVATVNGTCALHIALELAGIEQNDEVLTQALTFVATPNAISYCKAIPVFIDSSRETMGMCPKKLNEFLEAETVMKDDGSCCNTKTGRRIRACVPMHVYGHPVHIDDIKRICDAHGIILVEDAAESLGSTYKNKHTGTSGLFGIISFNGNKIVTTGGGGMILTADEELAGKAKHVTTTAKMPHPWEFVHDMKGYNYRLTNLCAALGCAQMESLPAFLEAKRKLANSYKEFFDEKGIEFFSENEDCKANYWLNCIILENRTQRDEFLEYSNKNNVMTRPIWRLMNKLEMYMSCPAQDLNVAQWLEDRIVCIPSSPVFT